MVCSKIKMADFWIELPGGVLLGHREGTPDGPAGSWTSMRMGKRSWWSRVAKCSEASPSREDVPYAESNLVY